MWTIKRPDQAPEVISNRATDDIGGFLKDRNPTARIYTAAGEAFSAYSRHVQAQHVVTVDDGPIPFPPSPIPEDWPEDWESSLPEDYDPGRLTHQEWQTVGNTAELDEEGPAWRLLDPEGTQVGTIPLELFYQPTEE